MHGQSEALKVGIVCIIFVLDQMSRQHILQVMSEKEYCNSSCIAPGSNGKSTMSNFSGYIGTVRKFHHTSVGEGVIGRVTEV